MSRKNRIYVDLMPEIGKKLISYSGQEVIDKIGADIIKDAISSILCGRNVRNLTEELTRRRIAILNGALLALFIKGCTNHKNFIRELPNLVQQQLRGAESGEEANLLLWLVGLTHKGIQNILRDEEDNLKQYFVDYQKALLKESHECESSYGKLYGHLSLNKASADVDWKMILTLFNAIGTQALAIRGAEKSLYGKLFERLVLGSCLSILGFKKIDSPSDTSTNKVFWLSSRGDKRESDATLLYGKGKGVRFDIGFIGPGNTEISLDKVSRFEREIDIGQQKYYMATFIIVDRIGDRSRIVELAHRINGTIIQMSMAYWPQELAKKLGKVLGLKHPLQRMPASKIEKYIKVCMSHINIKDFTN